MNNKELIKELNKLSLNARISYGIMCLENYAIVKHNNVDFTMLLKDLWKINKVEYIDSDWYYPMLEKSIDSIFEFGNYQDSDYEDITETEYNNYLSFYQKIKFDKKICTIIDTIISLPKYYIYTTVKDNGILVTNDIIKIINILRENKINLPNITLLKDSILSIADYTDNLDSSTLSKYLK